MTLQEFSDLHPQIIHYDRAGVEGINFDVLHQRIEKSRLLKTRRSFLFFAKNYARIIRGEYDDFTLEIKREEPIECPHSETIIRNLKEAISNLKALKLSPADIQTCKDQYGVIPKEVIKDLEDALTTKFGQVAWAFDRYNSIERFVAELGE